MKLGLSNSAFLRLKKIAQEEESSSLEEYQEESVRNKAVEMVGLRMSLGESFIDATGTTSGEIREYIDNLHDNGTMGQWQRFRRDCEKRAR